MARLSERTIEALERIDFFHEAWGPSKDQDEAELGLVVEVRRGEVTASEWTDLEAATGEEQPEDQKWSWQSFTMDLVDLMDPEARFRGSYSQDVGIGVRELLRLRGKARQDAIVDAAISRLAYGPNDERYVDGLFEEPEY